MQALRSKFPGLSAVAFAAAVLFPSAPSLLSAQASSRGEASSSAIAAAEASISADRIRESDRVISDDKFQGRYPGQRGGQMAAEYIAGAFGKLGLQPAGDHGTFMQQVDFVGMTAKPQETSFALLPVLLRAAPVAASGAPWSQPVPLKFGDDYTVSNQTLTARSEINAPIVFVGYGVHAPEFGWNDYAGIDVKGKVVLCIVGDPPSDDPKFFAGKAMTYYGRWTYKFEEAARQGAVGALIIHRTDLASYGWNVVQNSNTTEKTYLRDDANPRLKAASWIQLAVAQKIFQLSHLDFDQKFAAAGQRGFKAIELPVRLKATVSSTVRPFQSPNLIGGLPGANVGAGRPDQAVLYTAHYDHLGMRAGQPGDNIYNGAGDNGTGVAILLELARVWSEAVKKGLKLPHSVIFASVTAEEQGLLGSEYLGQHPPIPAAQIALDLNYDMLLPIGVQKEVNVNGAQRTTFYPAVEATAKRFGLAIVPDPRPEAGSYYRSDHFSLSRVGIPAFSIDAGSLYEGHNRAWGVAQEKDFNDNRYHNFSDNFDPHWDFTGDARLTRFGMDLGWQVINAPHTVEWKPGDEFEKARKHSEAGR